MSDTPLVPVSWGKILSRAREENHTVSVIVHGSYKPYVGKIKDVMVGLVVLINEYSTEYIQLSEIKALRVYD